MGLAYAFVLLREWRGSVVPSIIVHGISNGLVLTMLIVMLGT
jgi:membrane protease YdiL (CAAX protease family)